jgi:hypothetical protein
MRSSKPKLAARAEKTRKGQGTPRTVAEVADLQSPFAAMAQLQPGPVSSASQSPQVVPKVMSRPRAKSNPSSPMDLSNTFMVSDDDIFARPGLPRPAGPPPMNPFQSPLPGQQIFGSPTAVPMATILNTAQNPDTNQNLFTLGSPARQPGINDPLRISPARPISVKSPGVAAAVPSFDRYQPSPAEENTPLVRKVIKELSAGKSPASAADSPSTPADAPKLNRSQRRAKERAEREEADRRLAESLERDLNTAQTINVNTIYESAREPPGGDPDDPNVGAGQDGPAIELNLNEFTKAIANGFRLAQGDLYSMASTEPGDFTSNTKSAAVTDFYAKIDPGMPTEQRRRIILEEFNNIGAVYAASPNETNMDLLRRLDFVRKMQIQNQAFADYRNGISRIEPGFTPTSMFTNEKILGTAFNGSPTSKVVRFTNGISEIKIIGDGNGRYYGVQSGKRFGPGKFPEIERWASLGGFEADELKELKNYMKVLVNPHLLKTVVFKARKL